MSKSFSRRRHRPAAIAVAAAAAVVATAAPGIAHAEPLPYTLGAVVPTERVTAAAGLGQLAAAAAADGAGTAEVTTPPSEVDLTEFAVPPGNQGAHGACASFTTAYTLGGWLGNYTGHEGAPFSAMSVYNQVNGGSDTRGTTFAANFRVLETLGAVEEAYWTKPFSDFRGQPTAAEKTNAALHTITSHTLLFAGDNQGGTARVAIETALANNRPVALGIPVYDAFFRLNSSDSTLTLAEATGSVRGNHAVAVLGYDEAGVIVENSWGTGWGDGGFATLGWDFITSRAFEADAIGTFTTGDNALAPAVTALSASTVATGGGAPLTITAARVPSIDTSSPSAVTFVSVTDPSVSVPATVTAGTLTTLTVSVPHLPADGRYRVVLTGAEGASAPNGTVDVVTALSPYAVTLAEGQVGRTNAATKVTLVGTGFGTTATDFTANKVTATVNGRAAAVTRLDDAHLQVAVPAIGAGGTATVVVSRSGLAGSPVSVPILPPAPIVGSLTPAYVGVAGGTSVTVTLKNVPTAAEAGTVTLVGATNAAETVTAPITARTATTLTFTTPAAPSGAEGAFHVIVGNAGGASTPVKADVVSYRVPFSATTTATAASAAGGTDITLNGIGFGTTATAFRANKMSATVAGKNATLKWVDDTTLRVTAPAGTPGTEAPIVLTHDGLAGQPVTGVRYAAVITANKTPAGPTAGWTTVLTGAGFNGSGSWALVDGAGQTVAALPVVTSSTALSAATGGAVLVANATSATVHLPAAAAGMYRVTFQPNPTTYPSATTAFTSKSVVVYSDLG